MNQPIDSRVNAGVDAWLRWLPSWQPPTHRGRSRMCRRCLGSPILEAAGIAGEVPHQVAHALTSRMQRIIDRLTDEYIERELPTMHAELAGEQLWNAGGFDPTAGLDPEFDGIDLDPETDDGQPALFTFAELAEQSRPEQPLPRPPLSAEEKTRLRVEMEYADRYANNLGQHMCFALAQHRSRIQAAINTFVEPQIQQLMEELARQLEAPQ